MKTKVQKAKQPETFLMSSKPRKVRSDAVLKVLPAKRQDEIAEFARTHSIAKTREWLEKAGVDTNTRSLSIFLSEYRVSHRFMQIAAVVRVAMLEKLRQDPSLTPEKMQQIGQRFFSGLAIEREDAKVWDITQQIELKKGKLELEQQKHRDALKERRSRIKTGKKGSEISGETLEQIERELKLM